MFDLDKVLLAASKYNLEIFSQGQQEYTDPGTYSFIVPTYVTSISAVAIGGGGGGSHRNDGGGGGGGALQWKNNIPVTPGETLTVVVGGGGSPSNPNGGNGGESRISRGVTHLLRAIGGQGASGSVGGSGGSNLISTGGAGGLGGSGSQRFGGDFLCGGGAGAGGYTGNGGAAGTATNRSASRSFINGAGGGGAGGSQDNNVGRGGGGTGLHGQKNDGVGNGGGGSSYSLAGVAVNSVSSNSNKKLYPVRLSYAWSNFMNTYAVWTSNFGNTSGGIESVDRVIFAPYSGNYTLQQQADNLIIFKIDGREIARTSNFSSGSPQTTTFYMTAGRHVITMDVQNFGGGSWGRNPAGFAVVIRNTSSTIIWDTRTYASGNSSNASSTTRAGGTNANGMNGGDFGGGGSGRDGGSTAGFGGRGGIRIIWGPRRNYPYFAEDVVPFTAPTRTGLILHYDFNNANSFVSGSSVTDISGNNNTGSINRSLSALTFIGSNESFKYLPFPGNFNQKIDFAANELTSSVITVEMWAKVSSFIGGMFFGWLIHDVWTAGGTLGYNTGQGDVFGIPSSRINSLGLAGKWIHYAFVMNAGDYTRNRIYINSIRENLSQQFSRQFTGFTNFNSGNGRIGGWRLDNNYQQVMDLAIFRIWNRELSSTEISSLYNEDKNRFTVAYQTGLWGRRVGGYYNDNVNYWNGRAVTEARAIDQLAGFSSRSDQYSWQFKGYFVAPASGTYNFRLFSDDASHLWLGSNAVSGFTTSNAFINHGGLHGPSFSGINSIYLDAGSITPVRIMFGENFGQDVLSVLITGPGISGTSSGSGLFFHDDSSKSN
jgi:hypothetical protein